MNKGLCIFGAGGFAREVFFLAAMRDYDRDDIIFCDLKEGELLGRPVITEDTFTTGKYYKAVVAIGDPKVRERVVTRVSNRLGDIWTTLISPGAMIMDREGVQVGKGSIIAAGCILTCNIRLGAHAHLNLSTTVGHDVVSGNYLTTAPGVHISGNVVLGDRCYLGTNSSVIEGIKVGDEVVAGAGACVVRDLNESGTYVGVPAKKIA